MSGAREGDEELRASQGGRSVESVPFCLPDLVGEVAKEYSPVDEGQLRRAMDPESATESIHWGRNYLYVTPWRGKVAADRPLPMVVKQFRNAGLKARWRRRRRGTKAERAYRVACRLEGLGVGTPRPFLFADNLAEEGPSFFLSEYLQGYLESRYLLRSLSAQTVAEDYPELAVEAVFLAFGRLVRTLHDGHIWHKDLTCGNLLIDEAVFVVGQQRSAESIAGLYLLDLNRARIDRKLSLSERMRDVCRMEIPRDQMRAVWCGYWREEDSAAWCRTGTLLRTVYAKVFLLRNRSKKSFRGVSRRVADFVLPRRKPHAHIPATTSSSAREKTVWDKLSDQPHQHASKGEKLWVRLRDAPEHGKFLLRAARAYPRIKRRFREIEAERFSKPVKMDGFGVCVRPWEDDPEAVLTMVAELGVRNVLLRLHPWQEDHSAELQLAQRLKESGLDLAFSLPQDRSLVRDPELWRRRVAELARLFAPLGQTFQIGQAVNRSKWGVWKPSEYTVLFELAAQELRAVRKDVLLLGPSVIDFEFHQTSGYAFGRDATGLRLDGLASLLYVDRRGAPENEQLGLDSIGKGAVLRAIADTAPLVQTPKGNSQPLNWVTEVNWPLWEGPHSPAGRDVAVSEEKQAHYLARYYLSMLASGTVDRVYWWQVIAKGYGLVDWQESANSEPMELRRRPAFEALKTLVRELGGSEFVGWVGTAGEHQWLLRFRRTNEHGATEEIIVGWSSQEGASAAASTVDLPAAADEVCGLDGSWRPVDGGRRARLGSEVLLFKLAANRAAALG